MTPRRVLAALSWLWLIFGLFGLFIAIANGSGSDPVSVYPSLILLVTSTGGFAVLAALNR